MQNNGPLLYNCPQYFTSQRAVANLKVVGNEKKGGTGKCQTFAMSRTAAIDVLFSFNFAVVFDFMYFRFRPSKAK
jgi:hypothetical protein